MTNFHSLEEVDCVIKTQLQVCENLNYLNQRFKGQYADGYEIKFLFSWSAVIQKVMWMKMYVQIWSEIPVWDCNYLQTCIR